VRRDHHDGHRILERGDAAQELHAVELRHPEIGDHEVDVVLVEQGEGLLAVFGGVHVVAVALELRA
jgi:hypothetical protein